MITGDHFLSLAGKLASAAQADEATSRTAISRAYYSAFHLTKGLLQSLGISVGRNHGELQHCLLESGEQLAQSAGRLLVELHHYRIKADYELDHPKVARQQTARLCVEIATDFRTLLQRLDHDTHRQQLKAGIEAYRQRIRPT